MLQKVIFSTEANLFEGTDERKLPLYSIKGIHSRLFEVVGKMVAYLIVHLDIGIPCLSEAVYQYIATASLEVAANHCSIDDINDYEMKEIINQVKSHYIALLYGHDCTSFMIGCHRIMPVGHHFDFFKDLKT